MSFHYKLKCTTDDVASLGSTVLLSSQPISIRKNSEPSHLRPNMKSNSSRLSSEPVFSHFYLNTVFNCSKVKCIYVVLVLLNNGTARRDVSRGSRVGSTPKGSWIEYDITLKKQFFSKLVEKKFFIVEKASSFITVL